MLRLLITIGLGCLLIAGQANAQFKPVSSVPHKNLKVEVISKRSHDRSAFTQGLEFHDGQLLESTGLTGQSSLRRVDSETGDVLDVISLPADHFGEGLTVVDDRIIQLTWRNGIAHVYDVYTLEKVDEYRYEGEGWGICHDGRQLIMSDGSPNLTFRDPYTFEIIRRQGVIYNGRPLKWVNELEFVDGFVYGNIWRTDEIAKIDPDTGHVHAIVDASGLLTEDERQGVNVLNGIAWNAATETFLITGKMWPAMFEVRFVDPAASDPVRETPPVTEDDHSSGEESTGPTAEGRESIREPVPASSGRSE